MIILTDDFLTCQVKAVIKCNLPVRGRSPTRSLINSSAFMRHLFDGIILHEVHKRVGFFFFFWCCVTATEARGNNRAQIHIKTGF